MLNDFWDKFILTNSLRFSKNRFFLQNIPFVLLPSEILAGLSSISDDRSNQNVYYSVRHAVKTGLVPSFAFKASEELSVHFLTEFFSNSGFGSLTVLHFDPEHRRAIVLLNDNGIAASLAGTVQKPVCHYFRGIVAGIFSAVFNFDVECVEHHCTSLNDSYCEFIVKPQFEFDFSKPEIVSQLDVDFVSADLSTAAKAK